MWSDLDLEDRIEIERAGRSVFVWPFRSCTTLYSKEGSQDGGYSHSRVVFRGLLDLATKRLRTTLELPMACLPTVESRCSWSSHIVCWNWFNLRTTATVWATVMMISLHVDYPPCFVSSKFDFTSLIFVGEKWGWTNCLATPTARGFRNLSSVSYIYALTSPQDIQEIQLST